MAKLSIERAMGKAKAFERKGEPGQALQHYQAVLNAFPGNVRARQAIARLTENRSGAGGAGIGGNEPPRAKLEEAMHLFSRGETGAALALSGRLAALFPQSARVWNLEGTLRGSAGDIGQAEEAFRRVIALDPGNAEAHSNLGLVLLRRGETKAAIESLHEALRLKPDHPQAHNNLGNALLATGDAKGAVASYGRAIEGDGAFFQAHVNLGHALRELGHFDKAVASYGNALMLRPGDAEVRAHSLHLRQSIGDWSMHDGTFGDDVARLGVADGAIPPFYALGLEDDAGRQLKRSINWTRQKHRAVPAEPFEARPSGSPKVRIGYFSADFHDHATMHLMAGLLREHDRSRFEIHLYRIGGQETGLWHTFLTTHSDLLREVHDLSDMAIAEIARADGLDIAIDLKGYTRENRSGIFAQRVAPLQISYLGYPGSMGAAFMDYLVADRIVIPERERRHYSEKVIYLPGSYQPNDGQREIAPEVATRADLGLPETGLVLCCFNQSYKITPREFDIWMRVLGKVPDSVLWLLRSNRWAEDNLRREAEKRGVEGERLVFAEKLPHARHLARHAHADLFLDTFAVNAHTTASDALWAGLPLVTLAGGQFAARVAASLLHAVGLEELVAESEADYARLVLELARDPDRLGSIRSRLAENRSTHALFDTKRYARHFEKALLLAHARRVDGLAPADLDFGDAEHERLSHGNRGP